MVAYAQHASLASCRSRGHWAHLTGCGPGATWQDWLVSIIIASCADGKPYTDGLVVWCVNRGCDKVEQ